MNLFFRLGKFNVKAFQFAFMDISRTVISCEGKCVNLLIEMMDRCDSFALLFN